MIEVTSTESLRVEASNGRHVTVMDEPLDVGGTDRAMGPAQTLLAALGGCTTMTLQMYAKRKGWPLEAVKVTVSLERPERSAADQTNTFTQHVELTGPLSDEQRERLHVIAGRCPVHRLIEGPNRFVETHP